MINRLNNGRFMTKELTSKLEEALKARHFWWIRISKVTTLAEKKEAKSECLAAHENIKLLRQGIDPDQFVTWLGFDHFCA
jgi:hypothetical protein